MGGFNTGTASGRKAIPGTLHGFIGVNPNKPTSKSSCGYTFSLNPKSASTGQRLVGLIGATASVAAIVLGALLLTGVLNFLGSMPAYAMIGGGGGALLITTLLYGMRKQAS